MYFYTRGKTTYAVGTMVVGVAAIAITKWLDSRPRRTLDLKTKRAAIRKLLRALATAFDDNGTKHVRAHLMLRRKVRNVRCVDHTTAHNMHGDPDEKISMKMFDGISGMAAKRRCPTIADISEIVADCKSGMRLDKKLQKMVRPTLQTILSVPVLNPEDSEGELLGTLQLDSDLPISVIFPDTFRASQIAVTFADAASLMLGL
jgi:hypothetical protein